jgi:hypothetical protein
VAEKRGQFRVPLGEPRPVSHYNASDYLVDLAPNSDGSGLQQQVDPIAILFVNIPACALAIGAFGREIRVISIDHGSERINHDNVSWVSKRQSGLT